MPVQDVNGIFLKTFLCKGLVVINVRDRGGRKSEISLEKVVAHHDIESTFQTPSKNLPKVLNFFACIRAILFYIPHFFSTAVHI